MKHYKLDPYWLTARFPGICRQCQKPIKPGDRAYYYPATRSLYCADEHCGHAAHRDFVACAQDEAFYNGECW